jgi:hypothetical protein
LIRVGTENERRAFGVSEWALFDVGEKEREKESLLWLGSLLEQWLGGWLEWKSMIPFNSVLPLSFHTDRPLKKEAVAMGRRGAA